MNLNASSAPAFSGASDSADTNFTHAAVQTVFELTDALTKAEGLEHIYEKAVQGMIDGMQAQRSALLIVDDHGIMRFRAYRGLSDGYRSRVEGHSPWNLNDPNPQPILIETLDGAGLGDLESTVYEEGIRSLAFIPLISNGGVIGKLMVYFDQEHRFTEFEAQLGQTMAAQIAFAIDRYRADVARDRLAAIVQSSYDGIVSKTLEGYVTSWNKAAELLFGYSSEEMVGCHISKLIPEDRLSEEDRILTNIRAGRRVEHYETVRIRKNGQPVDVSITVSPIRDPQGNIVGASKIARNISTQKRAAEALAQSQQQLQIITDLMSAPVLRCSKEYRILWASKQYASWMKQPQEELKGMLLSEVLGKEAFQVLKKYYDSVLAGNTVHYEDLVHYKHIGSRWINATYTPTQNEFGETDGWVAVILDVTERKESEQRKDEFLATLAHELRNPLAPIRNAALLLKSQEMTPQLETIGGILDRQIDQLIRLVDDLMEVSRITRGRISLRKEWIDMRDVLTSAQESVENLIREAGHTLTVDQPDAPVMVNGDPVRLAQVVANLLNNAAKYTEPGGEIHLKLGEKDREIVVSVKDSGIGIEQDQIERVFEMFTQVGPSVSRSQGGLGIGLALVRGLVSMHNGTVDAQSRGLGKGSEFTIRLPVSENARPESNNRRQEPMRERTQPQFRILVVDDNVDHADSLALYFELQGHTVAKAFNGEDALRLATDFQPSIAILDIGLPKMNGYEVARRLRQNPEGKRMLLVALTGWGQQQDKIEAREAGFDHHMTKPVDVEQLARVIDRYFAISGVRT